MQVILIINLIIFNLDTGKTAILNQYIYHTFTATKPTTGIDFFTKMFEIQDFIVKLSIFDTAGQ
jgi:GTPase SAR1 family protein